MKPRRSIVIVIIVMIIVAVGIILVYKTPKNKSQKTVALKSGVIEQTSEGINPKKIDPTGKEMEATPEKITPLSKDTGAGADTGRMRIGNFPGKVSYDAEKEYYFLELRGARLPFKTSPILAQKVSLEAPGRNALEKNTALLYGMLGPEIKHATILVNPDEEDKVMPAVEDLARYIKIVNPSKFAGIAYTKKGGKLKRSVVKGSQIQSFEKDASSTTPLVLLKGPKSGASSTKVIVLDKGKFIVEGKTYSDLYKAADFVAITLVKMLCGSPDCPDAAACATGGDCGCPR